MSNIHHRTVVWTFRPNAKESGLDSASGPVVPRALADASLPQRVYLRFGNCAPLPQKKPADPGYYLFFSYKNSLKGEDQKKHGGEMCAKDVWASQVLLRPCSET